MFQITTTNGSITIRNIKSNTQLAVHRSLVDKEIQIHHNLEGKDFIPGMEIKKAIRNIMKSAGQKASYQQRFAKVSKAIAKCSDAVTFKVLANKLQAISAE